MISALCENQMSVGYVPQIINDHTDLSGGQRFNKVLTKVLSCDPDILLLDEPTNHLDRRNRRSLLRMLRHYSGTLIVVSHDQELLRNCVDTLWHIDNGEVHVFSGSYDDYMCERQTKRASIEEELGRLSRQRKDLHYKLMDEQRRVAKSKAKGEKKIQNREWTKMAGGAKRDGAEKSQGKKLKDIDRAKDDLSDKLAELRLPAIILPSFSITHADAMGVVDISDGSVGYTARCAIVSGITLRLQGGERIAIAGDNGSGKSTLTKAIVGDATVWKAGEWRVVNSNEIGYFDQHYTTLNTNQTVLEAISQVVPRWDQSRIRRHLADFLFRKTEEVGAFVSTLSGGEKARLSLAQISAKTPKLLVIDEITNNLDLETIEHVTQVLKAYPGAMIVVSHDEEFLKEIGVDKVVDVQRYT
jgi:ATPase subunit of ABC transporter with duplicated ATPase domains